MTAHSTLTGADLHEPKGADSAAADTVYVADGAGSGAWQKLDADNLDTSIKNVNKTWVYTIADNLNTTNNILVPVSVSCTLTKVTGVLTAALGGSNVTMNVYKVGGSLIGTFTILTAGSAKGTTYTLTPVSNNTFVANDYIEFSWTGAGTGTPDFGLTLDFTLT